MTSTAPDQALLRDPVCGMDVAPEAKDPTITHEGVVYNFCSSHCRDKFSDTPSSFTEAKDPVCGMRVSPAHAPHMSKHQGERFYFCCNSCKTKFDADPEAYLGDRPPPAPVPEGTKFTCPMHPEIVEDELVDCPLCGMALEPMAPSLDDGPNPELVDFTRRLWFGAPLAFVVFVIEMAAHAGVPLTGSLSNTQVNWLQLALSSPVLLWIALPFFKRGWSSILNRAPNMWTLIAIGTGTAYGYSVLATLFPALVPAQFLMPDGSVPVYFEAAAVIVVLVLVGQVMELRARDRTGDAIKDLMRLAPPTALLVSDDGPDREIDLADVTVGQRLRVLPGGTVPVDGTIEAGTSYVDESMVTGEPVPVSKSDGDPVTGGTLNGTGSFVMRAQHIGAETVLAQIISMVASAQRSRAKIQNVADKAASYFVPLVSLVAITAFVLWTLLGPEPSFTYGLLAAISVLIIACPCALGLATPMSVMVAMGKGASIGALFKDADALERFHSVSTLVLDKTGTVTEGRPSVQLIHVAEGFDEKELIRLVAGAEQGSEHPLARALVDHALSLDMALDAPESFVAVPGKGVEAHIDGRTILVGTETFLIEHGVDSSGTSAQAERERATGATLVFAAIDGSFAGYAVIADQIRSTSAAAIASLQRDGCRVIMATGDAPASAAYVAEQVGLSEVHAGLLPEDKVGLVRDLQEKGETVAMVGDGINDAPALAAANVGIAMSSGSDIALGASDITLVRNDLTTLVSARKLAKATFRNIRQNLFFAFAYNSAGVPVAAGLLYPFFGILLSPMIAAVAMSLSSVSVIGNALRLRSTKL